MKQKKKVGLGRRLQWRLECLAFLVVERLLALFPIELLWRLGAALAGLAHLFPSRWPTVRNNLRTVLGEEATEAEVDALTRRVFRHTAANLLTTLKGAHMSLDEIRETLTIENRELAEDALAEGKGVLLLIGHMGNWELLAQTMPAFRSDIEVGTIYRPLNNIYLDRIIRKRRETNGITMFAKLTSIHGPVRFLKDGRILALLVDQRAGRVGTLTPFFGRFMSMSPLPEFIQQRTGAQVLGASMQTTGPGRWTIRFHRPRLDPGEAFTTAHMAALMEEVIGTSLADEFWMQNLWRTNRRRPLELRGKRGPVRLQRDQSKPLYPFRILVRLPDTAEGFRDTLPALEALVASRPDLALDLLAPEALHPVVSQAALPHRFHAVEDGAVPDGPELAVLLTRDELAARDLARWWDHPVYSFPDVAQSRPDWHPITSDPALPSQDRWLAALRSLGMHDPPLACDYV